MGPQSRPEEFNLAVRWLPGTSDPQGLALWHCRCWWVHFLQGERRDRLGGRQTEQRKVTLGLWSRELQSLHSCPAAGLRNSRRGMGPWPLPLVSTGEDCVAVLSDCGWSRSAVVPCHMRRVSGDSVGTPSDPS